MAITLYCLGGNSVYRDAIKVWTPSTLPWADFAVGDWVIFPYCTDTQLRQIAFSRDGGTTFTQFSYGSTPVEANNSGNVRTGIGVFQITQAAYDATEATGTGDVSIGMSGYVSEAVCFVAYYVKGLATDPLDKSSVATGSSNSPSSGATAALSQADEIVFGAIGVEGPNTDLTGSWTTGTGYVSGNEYRYGTNSNGATANTTIHAAAEVVSATTAQTAEKTGITSRDWAAAIATFKAAGSGEQNITGAGNIASATVLGTPALIYNQTLQPSGVATAEAIGIALLNMNITAVGAIASLEAFGQPEVTQEQMISNAGAIISAEAHGAPTLSLNIQTEGIATAEGWGTPHLELNITVAGGIISAEALGAPQVDLSLQLASIASAEGFGSARLDLSLSDAGNIASAEGVGEPTVSQLGGTQTVYPDEIGSAEAVGQPQLNQNVLPEGIGSIEAVGQPQLNLNALPDGIGSGEVLGEPTLILGAVTVSPEGIASLEALGEPTLIPGAVTVSPEGIASLEVLGEHQLDLNLLSEGIASAEAWGQPQLDLNVLSAGTASAEAFGQPTVSGGAVVVYPEGIASLETLGEPTVTSGAVTVSPQGIVSDEALGQPQLDLYILPTGISSVEVLGQPQLDLNLLSEGIASAEVCGQPRLDLNILPTGIASAEVLGQPQLDLGIQPTGIASIEALGSPRLDLNLSISGVGSAEGFGQAYLLGIVFPDGDISIGSWTDQDGGTTNIYQSIDEPVPSEVDYIKSDVSSTPSTAVFSLGDLADPGITEYHKVNYRYRREGTGITVQLTVVLLQNTTPIATWIHPNVGTEVLEAEQTLTAEQAGNITDYTALRLKFEVVEV